MPRSIQMIVSISAAAVLLYCCAPTLPAWQGDAKAEKKATPAEIEKLIADLGSPIAIKREEASRTLRKIGEPALAALKAALTSDNAEQRRRAEILNDEIRLAVSEKRMRDKVTKATALGIDYFVGRMVRDRKMLTDDDWEILSRIEQKIKDEARARCAHKDNIPALKYKMFAKINTDNYDNKNGHLSRKCLAADSIQAGIVASAMVVCKQSMGETGSFNQSLGLFGKGVRIRFGAAPSSVLVVNGHVDYPTSYIDSVIISSGNVKLLGATRTLIIAAGKIELQDAWKCAIRENARTVFDEVGFFSSELVGLGIKSVGTGVEVRSVDDTSAFAKAGLKVGDRIVAINGAGVISTDNFRELLRERVLARQADLLIVRGEIEMQTIVQFNVD